MINELVSNDNQLFGTFYQAVAAETRLPENNAWDRIRESVDALLFPYYSKQIRFGALSLDGCGVAAFGQFTLTLREATIRERASIFEENSIEFVQRHRIVPGDNIPFGYRALWADKDSLAGAKLESKLEPSTDSSAFPGILMSSHDGKSDFIEVNIYGPIHRMGIASITGKSPKHRADKVLLESIKSKLEEIGARVEVLR